MKFISVIYSSGGDSELTHTCTNNLLMIFDPEEICLGPCAKFDFLMIEFYENPFPNNFIRNLRKFNKNETSDAEDICKKNSH